MNNRIAVSQPSAHLFNPLAAAIALILAGPGLATAATYQVTNTNDAGQGSLRQAIVNANANNGADEVVFDTSVSGTLNLTSGALEITDSVSIQGPGASVLSIDAGGASDIFVVSEDATVDRVEIDISGLTLTNATTAVSAELAFIDPFVTVSDSEISGNVGEGIKVSSYFSSSMLQVSNSVLADNEGNAINITGSPYSRNIAGLTDTVIANNRGAGVHNSGALLRISDTEITGNATGLLGGADWNYLGSSFDILNSTISNNRGNGILLGHSDSLSLEKSSVSGNSKAGIFARNLFISAKVYTSTIAKNGAGGIDFGVRYSDLAVDLSTVSGNRNGFGVNFSSYGGNARITESTITNNEFGGVSASEAVSEFRIRSAIIAGNGSHATADLTGSFDVLYSLIQNPAAANLNQANPGTNIFGVDPLLGALLDNGGPTLTHALQPNSPAIDQSSNTVCTDYDQRGIAKPQDGDGNGSEVCDMGAFELAGGSGAIGDYVWRDDNGDGIQNPGEPGLQGITVKLRLNCDPNQVMSTTTNSEGAYRFEGLSSGQYQLEFVKPNGYVFSPYVAAGDFHLDSNAWPSTGLDQCRSLNNGQRRLALDAGLIPTSLRSGKGAIGDYVWRDDNGDGIQDPGEPGLEGVTVKLRVDCGTDTVLTTTTNSDGAYRFEGLLEGNYQLQFVKPVGYEFSPQIAAGNYWIDSNADPVTGLDQCRELKDRQNRLGLDAGLVP